MEYKTIETSKLKHFNIRDIRESVVTRINERIEQNGFNPAHPLTVIEDETGYLVLDGNHRLTALNANNIQQVPCVVYPSETDGYKVAVQCNHDEDTYAPMDMFDWLSVIQTQKDHGKTQQEIGDSIGWNESKVKQYSVMMNKVTPILDIAKQHQSGRVTNEVTNVTFNFTEGWFRNSGLYNLSEKYQEEAPLLSH